MERILLAQPEVIATARRTGRAEYDEQVIAVYRSAEYWGALSTHQGATNSLDDIFELKRIRVRGSHTAEDLATLPIENASALVSQGVVRQVRFSEGITSAS